MMKAGHAPKQAKATKTGQAPPQAKSWSQKEGNAAMAAQMPQQAKPQPTSLLDLAGGDAEVAEAGDGLQAQAQAPVASAAPADAEPVGAPRDGSAPATHAASSASPSEQAPQPQAPTAQDAPAPAAAPQQAAERTALAGATGPASEAPRLAVGPGGGEVTEAMVTSFNSDFGPVLSSLGGTGDGGAVIAADLQRLFTADQLGKLQVFLSSHTVPQRMFNGMPCTQAMTSQLRILLSSHMLATGTFDPASVLTEAPSSTEEQESGPEAEGEQSESPERQIAANSCRHWAMMVYGYAGLPVPGEGADGLWHTHDATGGVNLGGTAPEQTAGGEHSAGALDHSQTWAPYFDRGTNAADIFSPGDWLQLAWSSGGGHSVVLVRVVRENQRAYFIDYYSQNRNGLDSQRRLDQEKRISKRMNDGTVVFSHRPMSQAQEATDAESMFSGLGAEDQEGNLRSQQPNDRYLLQHAPGAELATARPWLAQAIRTQNERRLGELSGRLTPDQLALLQRTNVVGAGDARAIEQLVRLNQRLVHTLENDRHTQFNAAQEDTASPHYRLGRYGGRGNGLYGAWDEDRTTEDGVVMAQGGRVGQAELRRITEARSSGELEDMPDVDQLPWQACPRGTAA